MIKLLGFSPIFQGNPATKIKRVGQYSGGGLGVNFSPARPAPQAYQTGFFTAREHYCPVRSRTMSTGYDFASPQFSVESPKIAD
jgi:hypothetical protein